jgi:hypothetical protein
VGEIRGDGGGVAGERETIMGKHYYYPNGTSAYEIPKRGRGERMGPCLGHVTSSRPTQKKPGEGMKAPTIKDARELGLFPSVTTIIGDTQRKISLEGWKLWKYGQTAYEEFLLLGTLPFNIWHNKVKDRAFTSEAADLGTQIHLIVESVTKDEELPDVEMEIDPAMLVAFSELWNKLNLTVVETEFSVAHSLGYGGRGDLWAVDSEGRDVILDYKTRDTKEGKEIDFYPELPKQLIAYAKALEETTEKTMGITLNNPRLISLVLSRTEPGRVACKEWPSDQYEGYWSDFLGLFRNWCDDNDHWPGGKFLLDQRMEE